MPQSSAHIVQCPQCGKTVPGWSPNCQFCGSTLTPSVPPPNSSAPVYTRPDVYKTTWQEVAYIVLSWIFVGLGVIVAAVGLIIGFVPLTIFGICRAALGAGLLVHNDLAIVLARWGLMASLFIGVCGLGGAMVGISGRLDIFSVIYAILSLGIDGFMLYIIMTEGQTDW